MSVNSDPVPRTGGCLCGAVRYETVGKLRPVINCHCEQCRKTSGHFVAATSVSAASLNIVEARGLQWYRSSNRARRGFCRICGSSLFWQHDQVQRDGAQISIMAGTLDGPTGLETVANIYTAYAGDYYRIDHSLPMAPDGENGVPTDAPDG